MALLSYITGFATLGFGVRCYQLALMKRNIFSNPGGHVLSTAAFAGVGYFAYYAEQNQAKMLAEKKEQLLRMRERDDALLASAGESSHH
ncbi:hypothetical protein JCM10908_006565 [Rhodotorula pacifica]|uniref:uncharacterized protein n=1 Tax=Rhodotorula pacifica TaxID=1495444 RepID=UPI0031724B4A